MQDASVLSALRTLPRANLSSPEMLTHSSALMLYRNVVVNRPHFCFRSRPPLFLVEIKKYNDSQVVRIRRQGVRLGRMGARAPYPGLYTNGCSRPFMKRPFLGSDPDRMTRALTAIIDREQLPRQ